MKEQASVDILNIYEERPSRDATEKSFFILYSPCDYKVVEKSEYERLKRLDENVKNKLEQLKAKACIPGKYAPRAAIALLESLYDEKP